MHQATRLSPAEKYLVDLATKYGPNNYQAYQRKNTNMQAVLAGLGIIVLLIVMSFICGLPVMLLWNWIMPSLIVGVGTLSFLKAVGLLSLCGLLFKSNASSK